MTTKFRLSFIAHGSDLKRSLLIRISLAALACLVAVAVLSALETRRHEESRAAETASLIAKHLDMQLWRISSGIDAASRFPDWDALLANLPTGGQCITLLAPDGSIMRNQCTGASSLDAQTPSWFASAWSRIVGGRTVAEQPVAYRGENRGTVQVTTDEAVVIARIWHQLLQFTTLAALILASMALLTYVTVAKALAPTATLVDGLERIGAGSLGTRLPPFRLQELDRIGKAANALAAQIESTLGERAELSQRLINAQESERHSLARELHDEFGQNLAAIAALSASIEKATSDVEPDVAVEARTVGKIAGNMQSALRGTLLRLKPAEVEAFGLDEGLHQLVDLWNASGHNGTRFRLDLPRMTTQLSPTTSMHIFRIAQEGLTNAARHAHAHNVRLRLEEVSLSAPLGEPVQGVRLTIEDDGEGVRRDQYLSSKGMGLINMRERVAALSGTIALEDVPGGGLRVRVDLPAVGGQSLETQT